MHIYYLKKAALCGFAVFCALALARGQSYYVQDLGTLGGRTSQAYALNNLGQVVGFADTNLSIVHAVLFSGTGSNNIDLDVRGGDITVGEARGINDSGQVIGFGQPSAGGRVEAILYSTSPTVQLGDLCGSGGSAGEGQAINNSGVMVGYADDCFFDYESARFGGTGTPSNVSLGGIGGGIEGIAYAINASGQVAGYGNRQTDGLSHAVLFSASGNVDLGTLGDPANSQAYGINDAGQIVGTCSVSNQSAFHATLFGGHGSNNMDLGTLGGVNSHAYAINNFGEIVGNSYPATNNNTVYHLFLYKNGVMTDVNGLVQTNSGFQNLRLIEDGGRVPGRCINDAGQIAAVGEFNGLVHAALLTPVLGRANAARNGNNIVVRFVAVKGKTYHLQQTASLANPNWQTVKGVADITATSTGPAQFVVTNGAGSGKVFYRVQLL